MHTDPSSADTVTGPFVEGAVPDHAAQLRSHFDLPKSLALDASAYEVSQLDHQGPLSNVTIPSYTRLDVGLTWKPWEQSSLSLVGQNLLQDHHLEFEDVDGALQSSQIRRSGIRESDLEILGAMKTKRDCEITRIETRSIAADSYAPLRLSLPLLLSIHLVERLR